MQISEPKEWKDYELIDCGNFEKLERFGQYILIRPEPQALWDKQLSYSDWLKMAHAKFERDNSKKSHRDTQNDNGGWQFLKSMPKNWEISYQDLDFKMKLSLTSFGHLGIFPEQFENWHYIHNQIKRIGNKPKVLNLFAYTGAASIVAAKAGADITHLDAVKNVVTWANENKQLSNAPDIRWMVDDALKYVKRQANKGQFFQGIIIDPPAYGRGPGGEKWVLEEQINELMQYCSQLADKESFFSLLNLYSMGLSGTIGVNLYKSHFGLKAEWGENILTTPQGYQLPLCTWVRCQR